VIQRMKRSKTDLEDLEWELSQNPGRRSSYIKKSRVLATRAELGLTAQQWRVVREKVEIFEVSPTADIAAEASRQLDLAEATRKNSKNIKGDLNNQIKMGIIISRHAVYKLAERAIGMGDPDMAAREKILALTRERDDLKKEVENLRQQRDSTGRAPGQPETIKRERVPGEEGMSAGSVGRITRSRANLARRRIPPTSDSESGSLGVAPLRSGGLTEGGNLPEGCLPGRPDGRAWGGPEKRGPAAVPAGAGGFPPLAQRERRGGPAAPMGSDARRGGPGAPAGRAGAARGDSAPPMAPRAGRGWLPPVGGGHCPPPPPPPRRGRLEATGWAVELGLGAHPPTRGP